MWNTLERPWQAAFEAGWSAFCHGSIPIGAVIVDETGRILSAGRNRTMEQDCGNPKIAHAETEALYGLDTAKYPQVRSYTLYTSMEPCPMCMGTLVMANVRRLRYAARDSYCGATHLCRSDPYMAGKAIRIQWEGGLLEAVQLAIQSYFELARYQGETGKVLRCFERDHPAAVQTARALYQRHTLEAYAQRGAAFSAVFADLARRLPPEGPAGG